MQCYRVSLGLVAEDKALLPDLLRALLEELAKRGCSYATPAPSSWLIAACDRTLITVYPVVRSESPMRGLGEPSPDIIISLEGDKPGSIVEAAQRIISMARRYGVHAYPLPL